MSAALATVDVVEATVDLTRTEAEHLTQQIRGVATDLVALLQQAIDGRAWAALDYPSFPAYVADTVGTALSGLQVDDRRQVIGVLADSGMSARAIGAVVGRSDERVRADLKLVRPQGRAQVVGMDGRTVTTDRPAAAAPKVQPAKTTQALDLLTTAAGIGLTIPELMRRKRWSYGVASATLCRLNAQVDRTTGTRRIERLVETRGGYGVYLLPEHAGDRPVLAPGERRGPA